MTDLYGAAELEALITAENLLDPVVECLERIWRREGALKDRHLADSEYRTRVLEKTIAELYPEFYTELKAQMGGHPLPNIESGCGVVMDGLSVREASQLVSDLPEETGWEVSLEWSPVERLPTKTQFICREWFGANAPSAVNRSDFRYIGDMTVPQLPGTDPEFVWTRFPDKRVENAMEGHYSVEELTEIYTDTKALLKDIVHESTHTEFLVSSDHGYVNNLGGNPYALPDDLSESLASKFSGRHRELGNSYAFKELEEAGAIDHVGEHYVVVGHHTWTTRGSSKKVMHGGLSLPECITPVLKIDTEAH